MSKEGAALPQIKDTIIVADDYSRVSISKRAGQKYARKLLQDFLKEQTGIKGYWTLWYDHTDEYAHWYTVDNPIYQAKMSLSSKWARQTSNPTRVDR